MVGHWLFINQNIKTMATNRKNKVEDIDQYKIGNFLMSLNLSEFTYLHHCMRIREFLYDLIETHKLSKKFICQNFHIKQYQYDEFVKGNYNYTIQHMSILNALYVTLKSKEIENSVPCKFGSKKTNKH